MLIALYNNAKVTYGPEMEKIMRKILLIAEVALLAEDIAFAAKNSENNLINTTKSPARGWLFENYRSVANAEDEDEEEESMTETDVSIRARKNSDLYDFPIDDLASSQRGKDDREVPQDSIRQKAHQRFIQWVPFKKNGTKKDITKLLETKESELEKLLGEWEEPEIVRKISVSHSFNPLTYDTWLNNRGSYTSLFQSGQTLPSKRSYNLGNH